MRVRNARYPAGIVAVLLVLHATPAMAQRRAVADQPRGMSVGVALGAAGVDLRQRGTSWDFGVLPGIRWRWTGERSGAVVAADVQPFLASGGPTAGEYRALWLLPAWELRAGSAGLRLGLGLGFLRFGQAQLDGRTEVVTVTGAGGAVRLPGSFSLELSWRRTGFVRGFRSNVWSLQLVRLWPL